MNNISIEKAKAFWEDLMGTLWGNPKCTSTHGIMGAELVAEHMNMTPEKANAFLWACVEYKLTERQGGGFVV